MHLFVLFYVVAAADPRCYIYIIFFAPSTVSTGYKMKMIALLIAAACAAGKIFAACPPVSELGQN